MKQKCPEGVPDKKFPGIFDMSPTPKLKIDMPPVSKPNIPVHLPDWLLFPILLAIFGTLILLTPGIPDEFAAAALLLPILGRARFDRFMRYLKS